MEGQHFTLDPVADGAITLTGFGFAGLLTLVLGTGEIRASEPSIPKSSLLSFDQTAVSQTIDPNAGTYSDIVLYSSVGFAVLDPIMSGFRDGWDAAVVDGFMYAESGALAVTLTDITKIAVRRPYAGSRGLLPCCLVTFAGRARAANEWSVYTSSLPRYTSMRRCQPVRAIPPRIVVSSPARRRSSR